MYTKTDDIMVNKKVLMQGRNIGNATRHSAVNCNVIYFFTVLLSPFCPACSANATANANTYRF